MVEPLPESHSLNLTPPITPPADDDDDKLSIKSSPWRSPKAFRKQLSVQPPLVVSLTVPGTSFTDVDGLTLGGLLPEESPIPSECHPTLKDRRMFEQASAQVTTNGGDEAEIKGLCLGLDTCLRPWYNSPFPAEYHSCPDGHLYMCEWCLRYMRTGECLLRHMVKCRGRMPPGDEIYRDDRVSVFEVDGRRERAYCQSLCLLAKMFLDHKTLYYDVETFLFYILVEWPKAVETPKNDTPRRKGRQPLPSTAYSLVGYFSKEKWSPSNYNLSCIVTLPHRQSSGYGRFLIAFSYELTKREGRLGTPEKPLSELGLLGYVSYWRDTVMGYLKTISNRRAPFSVGRCAKALGMTENDVLATLEHLGWLYNDAGTLTLSIDWHQVEAYELKPAPFDPLRLQWHPHLTIR